MESSSATHRVITRGLEWHNRPARVARMLLGLRNACAGHRIGTLAVAAGGAFRLATPPAVNFRGGMQQRHAFAKWCAGALVLMMPGSFAIVALLWIFRRRFVSSTRT
jgi:hypothetical protein